MALAVDALQIKASQHRTKHLRVCGRTNVLPLAWAFRRMHAVYSNLKHLFQFCVFEKFTTSGNKPAEIVTYVCFVYVYSRIHQTYQSSNGQMCHQQQRQETAAQRTAKTSAK